MKTLAQNISILCLLQDLDKPFVLELRLTDPRCENEGAEVSLRRLLVIKLIGDVLTRRHEVLIMGHMH